MKILVLTKDETDAGLLRQMEKNIQKEFPDFKWEVTTDESQYRCAIGTYKIVAMVTPPSGLGKTDMVWTSPSVFLKNIKYKEQIWNDIKNVVVPALRRSVVETSTLVLSSADLQKLLASVSGATKGFVFEHPDGFSIGVNVTDNVDTSLTSADISAMLAAVWIFGAKGVRLT